MQQRKAKLARCAARVGIEPGRVRSVSGAEGDALEGRLEAAFFARGDHPSTLYLSGFRVPCGTVATKDDDAPGALQDALARLARAEETLFVIGDNGGTFLGSAADVAKLLPLVPEIWVIEIVITNEAMTWLIGFRHEELYLAGEACPPRGTA